MSTATATVQFPSNPTPSKVAPNSACVAAIVRNLLGCVVDKQLDGKPVKAIDAHAGVDSMIVLLGKKNKWSVGQIVDFIGDVFGEDIPVYKKTRLSWKGDNNFYDTFHDAWNKCKGDATECSKELGVDRWGERMMTEEFCQTKFDMEKDDDATLVQQVNRIEKKGKGRKKTEIKLTDDDRAMLAQMVAEAVKINKEV